MATNIERITERIQHLVPDARFTVWDNDYDRLAWQDERPKPTVAELESVTDADLDDPETLANLRVYLRQAAQMKRLQLLGIDPADPGAESRVLMQIVRTLNAKVKVDAGRGRTGDTQLLADQEALADGLEAIENAELTIDGRLTPSMTKADIDSAAEWPA